MASWHDDTRWAALVDGSACPFCSTEGPAGVIAELPASVVTMSESVNVRGYCCVIPREHAVELHALSDSAALGVMRDVRTVARVVQAATGAIKLNYEIHGNIVPHVHMHIIPRYPGDAIERHGTGFARITENPHAPGEFDRLAAVIAEGLRSARTAEART